MEGMRLVRLRGFGDLYASSYWKDGHAYIVLFRHCDIHRAGRAVVSWVLDERLSFNLDDGESMLDMLEQTTSPPKGPHKW